MAWAGFTMPILHLLHSSATHVCLKACGKFDVKHVHASCWHSSAGEFKRCQPIRFCHETKWQRRDAQRVAACLPDSLPCAGCALPDTLPAVLWRAALAAPALCPLCLCLYRLCGYCATCRAVTHIRRLRVVRAVLRKLS